MGSMNNRGSRQSTMQQLGPYMGLGFQLAAAMVAFGFLGRWLDGKFGTDPWLMVVGLLRGATGGMISVIRTSLRSSAQGRARSGPASSGSPSREKDEEGSTAPPGSGRDAGDR